MEVTSPYRNERDALRERKANLEGEIAKLREETAQIEELRRRQAKLAQELAAIDSQLGEGRKRTLPLLDNVAVASPCHADWNGMLGDERVRFCPSCEKNVYNLSAMPRDEAERLLAERLGNDLCVRYYQRADGTILTADCPVGVKRKRRRKIALAAVGATATALAAAQLATTSGRVVVQGEPISRPPVTELASDEPMDPVLGEATVDDEPMPTTGATVDDEPMPTTGATGKRRSPTLTPSEAPSWPKERPAIQGRMPVRR